MNLTFSFANGGLKCSAGTVRKDRKLGGESMTVDRAEPAVRKTVSAFRL